MSFSPIPKQRLTFHSGKTIFGEKYKSGIKQCLYVTSKLILEEHINIDGYIDIKYTIDEYELWSYIYYLYYYNHDIIDEFKQMDNIIGNQLNTGKINAENMYYVVRSVVEKSRLRTNWNIEKIPLTKLIYFVKHIIDKYGDKIRIPILELYRSHLNDNRLDSANIKVRTGDKNARINTDPNTIRNSDIVISIK